MAKVAPGDTVYVPARKLPVPDRYDFALVPARVEELRDRSVRINVQDEDGNDAWVSSTCVHVDQIGFTVLRVGDFDTEDNTLDPLAKSLLHYLRLLVPPEAVNLIEVRTMVETRQAWARFGERTSHVVLIGHGSGSGLRLLDRDRLVDGDDLVNSLDEVTPTTPPKVFVSLSCETGKAEFARPFSSGRLCSDFLAPLQVVPSASASLFAQTFFSRHLLSGQGVVASRRAAAHAVGAEVRYRHWRDGAHKK